MIPDKLESPKNVLPDLIIPAAAVAFTIYYLSTITEVPWISQASAVTVSGLLMLCIAAYAIRTVHRIRRRTETISLDGLAGSPLVAMRRLLLLGLTVGYVLAIGPLGFTLTTAAFVFCGVILLSSFANWRAALAVSVSCSVIGYVVFIYFFQTRFPKGVVERLLERLG